MSTHQQSEQRCKEHFKDKFKGVLAWRYGFSPASRYDDRALKEWIDRNVNIESIQLNTANEPISYTARVPSVTSRRVLDAFIQPKAAPRNILLPGGAAVGATVGAVIGIVIQPRAAIVAITDAARTGAAIGTAVGVVTGIARSGIVAADWHDRGYRSSVSGRLDAILIACSGSGAVFGAAIGAVIGVTRAGKPRNIGVFTVACTVIGAAIGGLASIWLLARKNSSSGDPRLREVLNQIGDIKIPSNAQITVKVKIKVGAPQTTPISSLTSPTRIDPTLVAEYDQIEIESHFLNRIEWEEVDGRMSEVQIYDSCIHIWPRIAQELGLSVGQVASIRTDGVDEYDRVTKVFGMWLDNANNLPNKHLYPKTWTGLITLLNNVQLGEVSDKVCKALLAHTNSVHGNR